ncbi:MAG: amino acid ABC transporter permease [Chloroflexota bacterium]
MSSISTDFNDVAVAPPRRNSFLGRLATFPWWGAAMIALGIWAVFLISGDEVYSRIFGQLQDGVRITLMVSFVSYGIATVIGILVGIARSYPPDEESGFLRVVNYHIATFYVEVFRGLPILVVLLITTFVAVPQFINFVNDSNLGFEIDARSITYTWRAIIALGLSYGAFLSEVFRAGIQSIERGQIEAAQALGLTRIQIMRHIILPQALRRVLPPLGNDLIAMIKDSSLVAILAVRDITQLAKLSAGQSFLYLETYLVAAALYLFMTIIGSTLVRMMERRMGSVGH